MVDSVVEFDGCFSCVSKPIRVYSRLASRAGVYSYGESDSRLHKESPPSQRVLFNSYIRSRRHSRLCSRAGPPLQSGRRNSLNVYSYTLLPKSMLLL